MKREKICAGNWKMCKTPEETRAFFQEFLKILKPTKNKIIIFPPAYDLPAVQESLSVKGHKLQEGVSSGADNTFANAAVVEYGPQNIHFEKEGAFTGEISAAAVKTMGANYALIGHSERRTLFHETNELIAKKMKTAIECGLTPVLCVGETLAEREADHTYDVILKQLKVGLSLTPKETGFVIAYEPVWAIGTGKVATPEQASEVHSFIRQTLVELTGDFMSQKTSILYGGSVKPDNASGLAAQRNIDGFLVGGASLKPQDFAAILAAL